MQCLIESRMIYNNMLEMMKAQYERDGTFLSKYDLENAFKGHGTHVPATTIQMLADRRSKSLKRFLVAKQNTISKRQSSMPIRIKPVLLRTCKSLPWSKTIILQRASWMLAGARFSLYFLSKLEMLDIKCYESTRASRRKSVTSVERLSKSLSVCVLTCVLFAAILQTVMSMPLRIS